MKHIVVIEKSIKIREWLIKRLKQTEPDASIILLDSLDKIQDIVYDDNTIFFVNEDYGIDFQINSRYLIIHKYNEITKTCNFTLFIRRPLNHFNDVRDEIYLHKDVSDYLIINDSKEIISIPLRDILYIERIKRYSLIKTADRVYMTKQSFNELLPKLPDNFAQTHRSYIVNFYAVREFMRTDFILETNDFVPISRSYSEQVKEKWNHFFRIYLKNGL